MTWRLALAICSEFICYGVVGVVTWELILVPN